MANDWYYAQGAERKGPVPLQRVKDMVTAGAIKPDTLVWHAGMSGWEQAGSHFHFVPIADPEDANPGPVPMPKAPPAAPATRKQVPNFAKRVADRHKREGLCVASDPRTYADSTINRANVSRSASATGAALAAPPRGPFAAIKTCFQKYATFRGRASRSEYWWFMLFVTIAQAAGEVASNTMGEDGVTINGIILLATVMPSTSVQVRRLHDTNRSGLWILGYWLLAISGGAYLGQKITQAGGSGAIDVNGLNALGTQLAGVAIAWAALMLFYTLMLFVAMLRRGTPGPNRFG